MSEKKGHTRESAAQQRQRFQIITADHVGVITSASPRYWGLWPDATGGLLSGEITAWVTLFDRKSLRLHTIHPVTAGAFLTPPAGIVSPTGIVRQGTHSWPTVDAWARAHGIRMSPGRWWDTIRAAKRGGRLPDGTFILNGGGRRHD
jgi:hypothetical protein